MYIYENVLLLFDVPVNSVGSSIIGGEKTGVYFTHTHTHVTHSHTHTQLCNPFYHGAETGQTRYQFTGTRETERDRELEIRELERTTRDIES